jgi:hypothetical protein
MSSFGVLEPRWSTMLRGKSCSKEKSRSGMHPDVPVRYFRKGPMCKGIFKLRINVIMEYRYFELQIHQTKPPLLSSRPPQSVETIPYTLTNLKIKREKIPVRKHLALLAQFVNR